MTGIKGRSGSGGPRRGSGPRRRRLFFTKEQAQLIALLTKHRRSLLQRPDLTEEDVVIWAVAQEWQLDEQYQDDAEKAMEGE